jgi:dolichol-phosphate mannosyltransferase
MAMASSVELSIVFPAFNEAANLRRFTDEVFPVLDALGRSYEIVIVDDGSVDETAEVATGLRAPARLVRHSRNQGLGAALRTGFSEAKGDLVITMDTDLTFSPTLVPELLARWDRGDVDVVSGSPRLAGYASDIPSYRIVVSRLSTLVYSAILGTHVTSVSPIFRLYRRVDLAALDLRAVGFDINVEILYGLLRNGKRLAEIPAPLTQRIHGQSNLDYYREMRRHLRLVGRMVSWKLGFGDRSKPAAARSAEAKRAEGQPSDAATSVAEATDARS